MKKTYCGALKIEVLKIIQIINDNDVHLQHTKKMKSNGLEILLFIRYY